MKTALISVSNKTGIVEFARGLKKSGIKILSTGGTAKLLKKNNIKVTQISKYIRSKEMFEGRVKSLHPKIYAGILAVRKNKEHMKELKNNNIDPIDIVVVNLYPFEETVGKKASFKQAIENIDIGGPTLVRAAAKNFQDVAIVVDPDDYNDVLRGKISKENLALKAFEHTARYGAIINNYFNNKFGRKFPDTLNLTFKKVQDLRYGENPHQKGAFYKDPFIDECCITNAKQLHGKELSYNNLLDMENAFELIKEFTTPSVAIIKHNNPCGIASRKTINEAYKAALEADPLSAFGSIVALNRNCDKKAAEAIKPHFVEVVICPKFDKYALDILKQKKNVRLMETGSITKPCPGYAMTKVTGGLLMQTRDHMKISEKNLKVVSKRKPTKKEIEDMIFAFKVNKHVKSNSIVFVKNNVTTGIGAGQTSRVDAVKIAADKSKGASKDSVMSSDAFFPFRDGIDEAAKAGITAVIQPGGSIRDNDVIDTVNEYNMAMVFTGIRLFRH
jgi:phosphoribosylaminoimidazolecarboxamide formyltransferase/IMP cyclohydrolase|tara:strand:+ start:59181 stop:60686 length:1506 start_codon:yes stop_codon:yes gene_type:complete